MLSRINVHLSGARILFIFTLSSRATSHREFHHYLFYIGVDGTPILLTSVGTIVLGRFFLVLLLVICLFLIAKVKVLVDHLLGLLLVDTTKLLLMALAFSAVGVPKVPLSCFELNSVENVLRLVEQLLKDLVLMRPLLLLNSIFQLLIEHFRSKLHVLSGFGLAGLIPLSRSF